MSGWVWAVFAVAAAVYATASVVRTWRRERALTAQCRADEQAKTEAVIRQIEDQGG